MRIELKKFGNILTSREAGREALAAFLPTLHSLDKNEEIIMDFQGVSVLTPSWADEFIRSILNTYPKKVSFINDANPSVQAALRFANPKFDLSKITVFGDIVAFHEVPDDKICNTDKAVFSLTFPYSDEEALRILVNKEVKEIRVHPVEKVSDARLKAVTSMLNRAGICTIA